MRTPSPFASLPMLALALFALSAPTASATAPPDVVLVTPAGAFNVTVSWTPAVDGTVVAYQVYLMDDARQVILYAHVGAGTFSALAPGGFLDYGVAGWGANGAGPINWFTTCVSVRPPPPHVYVSEGVC